MPNSSDPSPTATDDAVAQLARLAVREQSTQTLLQTVVDLTATVLPGQLEASITLLLADQPTTPVFTGELALALDETQYGRGHGPCLHAATSGELTEISDATTETRWPDYMQGAVARGSLSSLSVPIPTSDVRAALNVYAADAHAFDEDARSAATRFVPYAAAAINTALAYQSARDMAGHLEAALQSRAVIDQAKGVLVERFKVTPDQAFDLLRRASMHGNRKLRDVADHLVLTGEIILDPRPDPTSDRTP